MHEQTVVSRHAMPGMVAQAAAFSLLLAPLLSVLLAAPLQAAQPARSATVIARIADSLSVLARERGDHPPAHASAAALVLPFALAADARLRAPGTSRFAGEYVGAASVDSLLEALCQSSTGTVAGIQQFAADSTTGAILVLRSARAGDRRVAWHEVIVYTLDESRRMRAIELYVEDQRAWDRRYPREDGVSRTSVVTQRNVRRARAMMRDARFVAGNGDRVLAVFDGGAMSGSPSVTNGSPAMPLTTLLLQTIAPSGDLRRTITYTASAHAMLTGAVAR